MSDTQNHPATLIFEQIDPLFVKLAKRLQQVSSLNRNGLSIVSVSIILYDGQPIQWTRPEVNNLATLEPKGNSDDLCCKLKNVR